MSGANAEADALLDWLPTLSRQLQREIASLFDSRIDDISASLVDDAEGLRFEHLPIGLATTSPEAALAPDWWQDFYEYAADGKYVFIREPPPRHICTRARAAREALRRGYLTHRFTCSAANPRCPMRQLLGKRTGLSLTLLT